MTHNPRQGLLKNARSPSSIANAEHHDPSGSGKNINGSAGTIQSVIADSTLAAGIPMQNYAIVRAVNTTGATAFLWFGEGTPPVPSVANSFAMPAGSVENFHLGAAFSDIDSIKARASVTGIQLVIVEC